MEMTYIPGGLLYYMKAGHMQGLPAQRHEIRSEKREREEGREGGRKERGRKEGGSIGKERESG